MGYTIYYNSKKYMYLTLMVKNIYSKCKHNCDFNTGLSYVLNIECLQYVCTML